jgi:hypothetical protein
MFQILKIDYFLNLLLLFLLPQMLIFSTDCSGQRLAVPRFDFSSAWSADYQRENLPTTCVDVDYHMSKAWWCRSFGGGGPLLCASYLGIWLCYQAWIHQESLINIYYYRISNNECVVSVVKSERCVAADVHVRLWHVWYNQLIFIHDVYLKIWNGNSNFLEIWPTPVASLLVCCRIS